MTDDHHNENIELREPLGLLSGALWLHAIFMTIGCAILLPIGIVAARRMSEWHRYIQIGAFGMVLNGVALALFEHNLENHGENGGGESVQKRHLPSIASLKGHEHSSWHSAGGLFMTGILGIQLALGCLAKPVNRSVQRESLFAAKIHQLIGFSIVMLAIPIQMLTGVTSALQLCSSELSGIDQCVGHNAIGMAAIGVGVTYYVLGRNTNKLTRLEWAQRYYVFIVENFVASTIGLLTVLYSLNSELPYSEHPNGKHHVAAGTLLFVFGGIGVGLTWHAMTRTKLVSVIVWRGMTVALTAIITGLMMFSHQQHTQYGRVLHILFGIELLFAAIARLTRYLKTMSALLFVAAFTFMASQMGFQILFEHFYSHSMSIGGTATLVIFIAIIFYLCMIVYVRAFFFKPAVHISMTDDADVDDLLDQRVAELVQSDTEMTGEN